jgi:molybdopterin converting factor small subunit
VKVLIPHPLRSYTGVAEVDGRGGTIAQVLGHLEERFPGIRFRMIDEQGRVRPHIRFFVDGSLARDLETPLRPEGELMIVAALSGG